MNSPARLVSFSVLILPMVAAAEAMAAAADGAAAPYAGSSEAVFLAQIIVLIASGRLLGEAMLRVGQPAIMGQLIAGILLGPSVLGALWPELQHAIFPRYANRKRRSMPWRRSAS